MRVIDEFPTDRVVDEHQMREHDQKWARFGRTAPSGP
jgi:hypothetical protein